MNVDNSAPFTTLWVIGAIGLSALEKLKFLSQYQLFYSSHLVFHAGQYWRLLTTFLYFGSFSGYYLFNLFITMRYAYMLESETFGTTKRAEFSWLLLTSSVILLGLSSFLSMSFLSEGLCYILMYIWCRRNRHVRMGIFGLIVFSAPYQPYIIATINWALRGFDMDVFHDLASIGIGQFDVWPNEFESNGYRILDPPTLWYVCYRTYSGAASGIGNLFLNTRYSLT